jgi:hypothetical protein
MEEPMMRRTIHTALFSLAVLASFEAVSAQRSSQSDATGAVANLFSRGYTRAFGAPPAPPPTLIVTPAILDALCIERAHALLTYVLARDAERTVLALLRGGSDAAAASQRLTAVYLHAGADAGDVETLISATNGLLRPERPEVPAVAAAINAYNELVQSAAPALQTSPPAELVAMRVALGRLTAAANAAVSAERVYPDLPRADIHYGNDATWLVSGQPIQVMGSTYVKFGTSMALGERSLKRVGEFSGVWLLAEEPVSPAARTVYVPLRTACGVELQPYALQEKVIKGPGFPNR